MNNNLSLPELYNLSLAALGFNTTSICFNEEIKTTTFCDRDHQNHIIFTNNKYYSKDELLDICDIIYCTIFDSGEVSWYRTQKWNHLRELTGIPSDITILGSKKRRVSIITIASVLMCAKPRLREPYNIPSIISKLCYLLDK